MYSIASMVMMMMMTMLQLTHADCASHPRGNVSVMVGRPEFAEAFNLTWQHNCADTSTQFTLVAPATGWLAFGLCDAPQRPDADAMVGCEFFMFNAEGAARNGGNVSANGEPKALAVSMIRNESLSVAYVESVYTVSFVRAWKPVDATHAALDAPAGLRVMASRGPTSFFGVQHFGSDRAQHPTNIFLFGAPPSSQTTTAATGTLAPVSTSTAAATTILHSSISTILQLCILILYTFH